AAGTISIRISWRLLSSSVARMLMPVVLPPGRASEYDQALPDHVVGQGEDRDRACGRLRGPGGSGSAGEDGVDLRFDQVRCHGGKLLGAHRISATIHDQVLAFDKT